MGRNRKESDIYDYEYNLSNSLKRIDDSRILSERDKNLIRDFMMHLRAKRVSVGRLAKYAFTIRKLIEHLGTPIEQAGRRDIERLSRWIQEQGYSPHTVSDDFFAIKYFYKFVRFGNTDHDTTFPDEVRWLKAQQKANERRDPEFFTPAEAKGLVEAADRLRDKCMLSISFELGLRPSELLLLNVGDVSFDDKGAKARVRGKTGERTLRVIPSAPLLGRYLESHPLRRNPASPLWVNESTNHLNERLSWTAWNRVVKQIAAKAGINGKRIHHYLLRHGSATEASKHFTDSELKIIYGWTMSSRMPAVYVHLSARDIDPKLERLYTGKVAGPLPPEFAPLACPRCHERNSPGSKLCWRCGTPLEQAELSKSMVEIQELRTELQEVKRLVIERLSPQPSQGPSKSSPDRSS
jgi:site-specific recombinase XerD